MAEKFENVKHQPKLLRVYGKSLEEQLFPIPRDYGSASRMGVRYSVKDQEERRFGLHHKIRQRHNSYASRILKYDWLFRVTRRKRRQEMASDRQMTNYNNLLKNASGEELKKHDVIFCTCTLSWWRKIAQL